MIVKISKVEIVGPKDLLHDVLAAIRRLGILHVERDLREVAGSPGAARLGNIHFEDEEVVSKYLLYENLIQKIDGLLSCLPETIRREVYLPPSEAMRFVGRLVDEHTAACRELRRRKEAVDDQAPRLERVTQLLEAIEPFLKRVSRRSTLDFTALEIRDEEHFQRLALHLGQAVGGPFEVRTARGRGGRLHGLIIAEKAGMEELKRRLAEEKVVEVTLPPLIDDLPIHEKLSAAEKRLGELRSESAALMAELNRFAQRWTPVYEAVRRWLHSELALARLAATLLETDMCFFLCGWVPSDDLERLRGEIEKTFGGKVVVEEKEIRNHDLDLVPVILKNPPYFQPFELFTSLLPLPRYTSFDPTPFLGVFFPIFFGMILGDVFYGLVLLAAALFLIRKYRERQAVRDGGKILLVSSLYAVFFGVLFGEWLGEYGGHLLGFEPIWIERRTAIIPMLYFSLAVGICHIILGLFFGFLGSLRRRMKKEALFHMTTIFSLAGLLLLLASLFLPAMEVFRRPLLIALAVGVTVLIVSGGFLAPLEFFKTCGNIVSYARIMAVGLASVLLAHVANTLAGNMGSIVAGVICAVVLHVFNILLGVFAPTIHSLRLHYVEFFGKFLESGGRKYDPLKQ